MAVEEEEEESEGYNQRATHRGLLKIWKHNNRKRLKMDKTNETPEDGQNRVNLAKTTYDVTKWPKWSKPEENGKNWQTLEIRENGRK